MNVNVYRLSQPAVIPAKLHVYVQGPIVDLEVTPPVSCLYYNVTLFPALLIDRRGRQGWMDGSTKCLTFTV